ncbi:methyl-accepting chemotaxis protein [Vibrio cholerae MZO-2]|nr:methyl-accepting chemotaxis protein [Vibrio cholerae MZO-2]
MIWKPFMPFWKKAAAQSEVEQHNHDSDIVSALKRNLAYIEFDPQGKILDANALFLSAMGYTKEEVIGQHHKIFCDPETVNSLEYAQFWKSLAQGQAQRKMFHRLKKDGSSIWIEATYMPVRNRAGDVYKVTKVAHDVTKAKITADKQAAVFHALDRSSAMIQFNPDGTIKEANENFLKATGYRLEEIVGKHHRMFCDDRFYKENPNFWRELARGEFKSGLFHRRTRHGQDLWLEATYNPIFNDAGVVTQVVKFASDVTDQVLKAHATKEASQMAQQTSAETVRVAESGREMIDAAATIASGITESIVGANALMTDLSSQSQRITQIVTTINKIAEQTNLLALNAAIEAARAGEYGRGFAVVADEVRSLASNTSQATSEIDNIVKRNSQLTEQSGQTMEQIQAKVTEFNHMLQQTQSLIEQIQHAAENVQKTVSDIVDE